MMAHEIILAGAGVLLATLGALRFVYLRILRCTWALRHHYWTEGD